MTTPPPPGNLPDHNIEQVDQPAAQAQPVTAAAGENAYGVEHRGMFGVPGTGDTSGFGGLPSTYSSKLSREVFAIRKPRSTSSHAGLQTSPRYAR